MLKLLYKLWNRFLHGYTILELLKLVWDIKCGVGLAGGFSSGIIVIYYSFPLIVIILAITGGVCVALFFYTEIIVRSRSMKRLLNIEKIDKQDISNSLCISDVSGFYYGYESSPYKITFDFHIFNGSVFSISADSIKGHIMFRGKELKRLPEIRGKFIDIQRRETAYLTVIQYLEEGEREELNKTKTSDDDVYFVFEKVKFYIIANGKKDILPLSDILYKNPSYLMSL
jgi:hypothetical protein